MAQDEPILVTPQHERPPRTRMWTPHAVWACSIVIPFVIWMGVVSQSELPPGQCSGIGWGCSLAGWEAVVVGLVFIGVPLLLLLLVGHLITGVTQVVRSRRRATLRN